MRKRVRTNKKSVCVRRERERETERVKETSGGMESGRGGERE